MSTKMAMKAPVRGLVDWGVGLKSSDSEIERASSMVFVDLMFFVVLGGVPHAG